MKNVELVGAFLSLANDTVQTACKAKGLTASSITVNLAESDLSVGKIVGLVTVDNRSRKPFKVSVNGNKVTLEFLGQKLAA